MAKIVRFLVQPLSLVSKKVANIASSVALIGAGLITGQPGLIAAGVSSLASALKKKPKASAADRGRLVATIDPRAPRKLVFGRTAMATDICDQEFTGTAQEYLHRFIVAASHKVDAIQEIWFDDKLAWTLAGGVQGSFVGYLEVATRLEGNAGNAINISARMGATRRYTGLAYVHFRYKLTGNSKKTESPFASAVPSRITIIGEGMSCYDPRQDSSVGGSGAHRADNQATWTYGTHARNPACQALTYMLGWRINGVLAVGKGIPARRFDLASFMTAANVCDESQAMKAGGTESRYRFDGIFSEADDLSTVLGAFSGAMDARFYDPQGRIAVKCIVNDLATPIASFGPADIIDEVVWSPFGDLAESYNIVRGTYTDASTTSLYQAVDYPEQSVPNTDGIDRVLTLDFAGVQSATQAQRLAKRALMRAQLGGGTLSCEMQATAWRAEQFAPVALTFPNLGMASKPFRVAEIEARVDGTVPISLEVENAAIYAWNPATDERDGLAPVANTPYDPLNNPFVIGGAARIASRTVNYPVTSNDNSISIAAFDAVLDDGRPISLPAGSISSLASGTSYSVFWNLLTSAYEAVLFPAATEMASSNYVFIIVQNTSTGGVFPSPDPVPGGYCVSDDTLIMMAGGREKPARDIVVGDMVFAIHETSGVEGVWPVSHIAFVEAEIYASDAAPDATARHRFMIDGKWIEAQAFGTPCGIARVAKITVSEAHTYWSKKQGAADWLLSHNIKPENDSY